MRRLFTYFATMVLLVATSVGCGKDSAKGDYKCAVPNDAAVVVRFNANQVLVKSGLKAELTQMLRNKLRQEHAPTMVLSLLDDFRNTGVDVEAPMYLFTQLVDNENVFVGIVAKTYKRALLDKLIDFIPGGLKSEESGCTYVDVNGEGALAYNDVAVVIGGVSPLQGHRYEVDSYGNYARVEPQNKVDLKPLLIGALTDATNCSGGAVLPSYEGCDAAVCLRVEPVLEVAKEIMNESLKHASVRERAEVYSALHMVEKAKNGRIDAALNFANGSIQFNAKVGNFPKLEGLQLKPCSNANLKNISANAWAVANVPFDGAMLVDVINKMLENHPELQGALDAALKSEFNYHNSNMDLDTIVKSVKNVVLASIFSIKGDLTVALNNYSEEQYWDPNYDYYGAYRTRANVDACAMVNVTNESIMQAVDLAQALAYIDFERNGYNRYRVVADGVGINFGIEQKQLYAKTDYVSYVETPATAASWYPAVQGSYGYVVVNLSSVLSDPKLKYEIEEGLKEEFGYSTTYGSAIKLVKSLDYLLLTAPTPESLSLQLVLKNKNENVLKQIVSEAKHLVYNKLQHF